MSKKFDVIIIGGGVSGLSAALVLGRCCRHVLVLDEGNPRNKKARAMHGFPGLDGIKPTEFLETCRQQASNYNVEIVKTRATSLKNEDGGFTVQTADESTYQSDYVILAIGVVDHLPDLADIDRFYPISAHHCPICDGWGHRGKRLAAYGTTDEACGLALELKIWSEHVVLCTDGAFTPDPKQQAELAKAGISTFDEPISELCGTDDKLERILGRRGGSVDCDALFFISETSAPTEFFAGLDCRRTPDGLLDCTNDVKTSIRGLYAAGNSSDGLQLAIVAAAEGAKAAWAIHEALLDNK